MRKSVLYIAASLDGYIADAAGGVGWLDTYASEPGGDAGFPRFLETVDTIVVGHTTYRQVVTELTPGRWEYGGRQTYVFTHRALAPENGVVFTAENPVSLLRRLQEEPGRDIWICGGAAVVNALIEADAIDVYHITIIPVVLGDGIPLFTKHPRAVPLTLLRTETSNGMVGLVYERRQA
jgi:dihydrofolate reductase